jgi:formylglycine-generating enzyme required for sulfatase activity
VVEGSDVLHTVQLSAFELDRTEVTQGAYAACVTAKICSPPKANFDPTQKARIPVTNVSWEQARGYCAWAGKRLPTEAEWEKAARGPQQRKFPWGEEMPDCTRSNFEQCGGQLRPVGMLPNGASPYGALDMAGNVEEWVQDWFSVSYYGRSPTKDPRGPEADTGSGHAVRGGSFRYDWWHIQTSVRFWDPGQPADDLGFRCAWSR